MLPVPHFRTGLSGGANELNMETLAAELGMGEGPDGSNLLLSPLLQAAQEEGLLGNLTCETPLDWPRILLPLSSGLCWSHCP